jgi:hypothetical protein
MRLILCAKCLDILWVNFVFLAINTPVDGVAAGSMSSAIFCSRKLPNLVAILPWPIRQGLP